MNAIETQPSNGTISNHGKGNFMGSALIDKITPKTFRQFAAAAVDFLKINSIEEKFRHGKPVVIKSRNGASEQIVETLRQLGPEALTSESLTLEEIFVAALK